MTGSWHLYRPGERWQKPAHLARAVIEVGPGRPVDATEAVADAGWVAVCFSAPVVELVRAARTEHLGPDLCTADADLDEVVRLMGTVEPDTPLADVLLDQRICCGVGNVYKSEVPFALGLHPLTPIGELDDAHRRAVVDTAAHQLRANLATGAHHDGRSARHPRGLRPAGRPVSSVRHPDRLGPHRCAGPQHLLVPALPARGPHLRLRASRR